MHTTSPFETVVEFEEGVRPGDGVVGSDGSPRPLHPDDLQCENCTVLDVKPEEGSEDPDSGLPTDLVVTVQPDEPQGDDTTTTGAVVIPEGTLQDPAGNPIPTTRLPFIYGQPPQPDNIQTCMHMP